MNRLKTNCLLDLSTIAGSRNSNSPWVNIQSAPTERDKNAKENRATLKYFGQTEVDFPSAVVTDKVAIFDDHLEALMAANWTEWITACDNDEAAAGISLAKNQLAYRSATLNAEGTVPEMLMQILVKAEGK